MNTEVIFDMSREAYDQIQRVNWSSLKHMGKSPAHYRQNLLTPRKDTDALKFGRVVHLAVYEPEKFAYSVAVWGGGRRAGKEWDKFCEHNDGRELLTEEEMRCVTAISNAVRAAAGPYVSSGSGEVTVLWQPEGVDAKARLDFVSNAGPIVDLKTARDASPGAFAKQFFNLGYDGQSAWYVDAWKAATGEKRPYVIVAIEKADPFVVQVYRVPESALELGREKYRANLEMLAHCRRESKWPGYAEGEVELEIPRWLAPMADEDDLTGLGLTFEEH